VDAARIAALLQPFLASPLRSAQLSQIAAYLDLLLRWNARTNLTAVRDPEDIITRHFGESLFTAQALFPLHATPPAHLPSSLAPNPSAPLDLIDLGSGAGFPGIPIHILVPSLRTTLIESQNKKVAFLREVIRALTLTNINVFPGRAEDFSIKDGAPFKPSSGVRGAVPSLGSSPASLVTLRAVERFDHVLPTAASLVAPAGRLALLIAGPQAATAQSLLPNFQWQPPRALPESSTRILLIGLPPNQSS